MKINIVFFILLLSFLCGFRYQDSLNKIIVGKWTYEDGSYMYYDNANKFLGESKVNELEGLDIEVTQDTFKVLYPNNNMSTGKYSITNEKGKYFVSMTLSRNPFRYQIQSFTKDRVNLVTRQNVSFYVNGDINQKASYCILRISLVKKV